MGHETKESFVPGRTQRRHRHNSNYTNEIETNKKESRMVSWRSRCVSLVLLRKVISVGKEALCISRRFGS
jgi:hypothetical protein